MTGNHKKTFRHLMKTIVLCYLKRILIAYRSDLRYIRAFGKEIEIFFKFRLDIFVCEQ